MPRGLYTTPIVDKTNEFEDLEFTTLHHQTDFILPHLETEKENIEMFVDGVRIPKGDFTLYPNGNINTTLRMNYGIIKLRQVIIRQVK